MPLPDISHRVKRDVNVTKEEVNVSSTTETTSEASQDSLPISPALGPSTDELENELNKVLTANDDEVHKNLHSPEDNFAFDNVSK